MSLYDRIQLPPGPFSEEGNRIQTNIERALRRLQRSTEVLVQNTVINDGGPAFDGYDVQYVHPLGDNSNPGTADRPKRTVSMAYHDLVAGGDIYIGQGSKWSDGTEPGLGLTAGQGMYLDGNGLYTPPPGWLRHKNVNLIGHGRKTGNFGSNCVELQWGAVDGFSSARTRPGVWLASVLNPTTFHNLYFRGCQPIRVGWDYLRDQVDRSIAWANITSATRSGGFSVLTVDAPALYSVTQMARAGTTVSARISFAVSDHYCIQGNYCNVVSSDPDFPSFAGVITEVNAVSTYVADVKYTQAGSAVSMRPVSGVTLGGHMAGSLAGIGDIIEVESTNPQWPTTMYQVLAVTAATITVIDPYGYGSRSATVGPTANIGRYVLQNRFSRSCSFDVWNNVSAQLIGANTNERFNIGPTMDRGSGAAGQWSWITGGYWEGNAFPDPNTPTVLGCPDLNRMATHLSCGGSRGGAGFYQEKSIHQAGAIRAWSSATNETFVTFRDMMHQWGLAFGAIPASPCVALAGGTSVHADIDNCTVADSGPTPDVDLGNCHGEIVVKNVINVAGALPTLTDGASYTIVLNGNRSWQAEPISPQRSLIVGWTANDGRLIGKRDDLPGSFGVVQHPGYGNLANTNLLAWTADGAMAVTAGQSTAGLDGANTAYRLACSAGSGSIYLDITTPAAVLNDGILFGFWAKAVSGLLGGGSGIIAQAAYNAGGIIFDAHLPFGGDGEWQWITCREPIKANNVGLTSLRVRLYATAGQDYLVYLPTVFRLAASSHSLNDIGRTYYTFRPTPSYLTAGSAGTTEGTRLIGHGGLGINSAIVVSPSGPPATLASWEPRYAQNGTTVIGYEPIYSTAGAAPTATPSGPAGGDLAGTYPNPTIALNAVTFAKIQNVTTDRLLGRDTAGTGSVEEIAVGGGIEFTGAAGIQTSAFTGDVTKAAGGTALTIANNAVGDAKLRDSAALSVIGRSANIAGDPGDISAGAASGHVLRESGSTIGWGTIGVAVVTGAQPTITWPTAGQILVSSGTSTVPVGFATLRFHDDDANLVYDLDLAGANIVVSGANVSLSSAANLFHYNVTGGNYERVREYWTANVFRIQSEVGGAGTLRNIEVRAPTVSLLPSTQVFLSTTAANGCAVLVDAFQIRLRASATVASAAGATLDAVLWDTGGTISITGSTNITTATGFNHTSMPAPTYSGGGVAKTIDHAATLYIGGAPSGTSSATITNAYALWVDAGRVRLDGAVALGGGAGATLGTIGGSGPAAAAQAAWIPINSNGTTYYIPAWA